MYSFNDCFLRRPSEVVNKLTILALRTTNSPASQLLYDVIARIVIIGIQITGKSLPELLLLTVGEEMPHIARESGVPS